MPDEGSPMMVTKRAAPGGFAATQALWMGLFLAGAVGLAFYVSSYHLFQLTMVVVYAVAVLGMTILTGYNGQISLGQGAFFAIGSYTAAILMANYDWPYWATIPVAAVASALVGFLVGFPALRLGGLYLALTTFALAVAVPQILKVNALSGLTGGVQGLTIDKPEAPFGLPISGDQWIYLFSLGIGCVVFLLAWNLTRGRTGRAMMAVREQPVAAEAMGVGLATIKTRTFAVSAMITGIGGAFIEFIPNIANDISKAAPGAIYGAILIGFMFVMPRGVGGALATAIRRLFGRKRTPAAE